MSEFIMGLDVGYSNLVISCGEKSVGEPEKVIVLPVGAGPYDLLPSDIRGGRNLDEAALVQIDGEAWAAGVQPGLFAGMSRVLHEDYPGTKAYKALFYAALIKAERDVIDVLVTGLPASQFNEPERRQQLVKRLQGTHQVTPKTSVTVNEVFVVPQPAGTYLTALHETGAGDELAASFDGGMVLVLDSGFFSVDWVAFENGVMVQDTAGTDLRAMSRVLEVTADLMFADFGGRPSVLRIEAAVRTGEKHIIFQGKKTDFKEYYDRVSRSIADSVLVAMRSSLRGHASANIDAVILGGGGGESYMESAREAFPNAVVLTINDPVTSNAKGFWHCGR